MRHNHQVTQRVHVTIASAEAMAASIVPTEDLVHVDRGPALVRCTLRGVPARLVDVLVPKVVADAARIGVSVGYHVEHHAPGTLMPPAEAKGRGAGTPARLIVEIARKAGRYDGEVRDRITLRVARMPQDLACGEIALDASSPRSGGDATVVELYDSARDVLWGAAYDRLPDDLDSYDVARIVMWHWTRYYQSCVGHADAEALARAFAPRAGSGLAEANREASRMLYRLARDLGWRKLTLRERDRLGLDAQWVSETDYAAARESRGLGSPTGAGDYTLMSAARRR